MASALAKPIDLSGDRRSHPKFLETKSIDAVR
jgi:hypothetical protein